jgi:hypothetical protein
VLASVVCAQTAILVFPIAPIREDDELMPGLKAWEKQVAADYAKQGFAFPEFMPWEEKSSPVLAKLFPRHRFIHGSFAEVALPGKEVLGLAWFYFTHVFGPDGKLVKELPHGGDGQPFSELLTAHEVSIRSAEDAMLVWQAHCDARNHAPKDAPATQVSTNTWHLGKTISDGRCYYYVVKLDEKQAVTSFTLKADPVSGTKH